MNRKRKSRHLVNFSVKTPEGEGVNERMINYSLKGCSILSPVIFSKGDTFTLSFLPASRKRPSRAPLDKMGRVVWARRASEGPNVYGIQFIDSPAPPASPRLHPIRERGQKRLMEKIAELYRPFLDGGNALILR